MGMVRPTDGDWKVMDIQYLYYKAVTNIVLENSDGKRIYVNVRDDTFDKCSTTYFYSSQAKESPQTEDPEVSVVEAGTDFLMKVTEEAVLDAIGRCSPFIDDCNRERHRRVAQDIVYKRLTAFVNGEEVTDHLHEEDRDEEILVGPVPVPKPVTRPLVLPADRYAHGAPHPPSVYEEEYLDATQGPSS